MTIQQINIGSSPKGEGGDTWRGGSEKINANFKDLDERTTLAQNTADSKTTNETDEFLLGRENHTGVQPISSIAGLQDVLDNTSNAVENVNDAVIATDIVAKAAIPNSQKGIANGVATLDSSGVIPANQLPSYVDDVLEFATFADFPTIGETGKIYIATGTGKTYRWTGTVYVAIGGAETADTALRLFTARTIAISGDAAGAAVPFDGSDNISINISGVAATKFKTARKINGIEFDGLEDITVADSSALAKASNLSDLENKTTARTNLDVYSKSEVTTAISSAIPNATETVAGKAKIATTAIAQAGTNDTDFLTAKKLRDALNAVGEAPISAFRAKLKIRTVGGVPTLVNSSNIASLTTLATGIFDVVFIDALSTTDYCAMFGGGEASNGNGSIGFSIYDEKTTGFKFRVWSYIGAPLNPYHLSIGIS